MTAKPTNYEGFKEKLFWVVVSTTAAGVIALVGLVWKLSVNDEVRQKETERMSIMVEQTMETANRNNTILVGKADQATNEMEHRAIMEKMDDITAQLHRAVMKIYSEKQDTFRPYKFNNQMTFN